MIALLGHYGIITQEECSCSTEPIPEELHAAKNDVCVYIIGKRSQNNKIHICQKNDKERNSYLELNFLHAFVVDRNINKEATTASLCRAGDTDLYIGVKEQVCRIFQYIFCRGLHAYRE